MSEAEAINRLAAFCGPRDIEQLTPTAMNEYYGFAQADVLVLFGGSILCGGDVFAEAMRNGLARHYVIVGGHGHTTATLRAQMQSCLPHIDTANLSEAELFNAYLRERHGLQADALETTSTNCGNNITYLLRLLEEKHIPCRRIILMQDATMQRRMAAGLRKYRPEWHCINYATYQVTVEEVDGGLRYRQTPRGMWEMPRYIELLMGEIPRLHDDANGYGPRGKGYIAHEDIPPEVEAAHHFLSAHYASRAANPDYASCD